MNWFEKLISADELRVSALVVSLLAFVAAVLIQLFLVGHIPDEIVRLTETFAYIVGGVNAVALIKKGTSKNESVEPVDESIPNIIVKDSDVPEKIEEEQRI